MLYVAVLLHDIAKGRGGDHSLLGAEVALALCPRLGLTAAETETVAWLVRWHLFMSATAFKRDLADPKTIQDFVERVKSLERLRLLFLLTVVDIRAVGPGTWNSWKSQLLRALFDAGEEMLRLGHKQKGRRERIAAIQEELGRRLGWDESRFARFTWRLPDSYWLAEPIEVIERNARFLDADDRHAEGAGAVEALVQDERGATLVSVYAKDQPGLFYRIAGAISLAGGNIIDARIHTTDDGMALDNFLVQNLARRAGRRSRPAQAAQGRGGARAGRARALGRAARGAGAAAPAAPRRSASSPPPSSITRRRTATRWSRSTPATAPPCCSSWRARSTSRAR